MDQRALTAALARARAARALPPPPDRRQLRERAGLSQRDVARIVGVTREAVSLWETRDRTPRAAYVQAYSALLDRLAREAS